MAASFDTIGIFGRVRNPGVVATSKTLIDFLRSLDKTVLVEAETAASLADPAIAPTSKEELCQRCNLLIVVGGDGSLLHAAHDVIDANIPILGINRGRLGFLTDIHPAEFAKIRAILDGDYFLEKRFLLTTTVELHGKHLGSGNALNEVALIPDTVPHMTEFEIYVDKQFVCSQNSDGIIVATPTGSTAYALSGGGPIVHPRLDAMVMVPMFPHTLSLRPIVIEGNSQITIVITPNNTKIPRITCDSRSFIPTPPGAHITIRKKPEQLQLVHPCDYDYYESLRSKLHWGQKLQYTD